MVSLGLGMIDPNNPITELNNKMHQSDVYNKFQMGVSLVSSFSGAASQNMACFVAGTLVLTTAGLLAIEKINPGEGEGPDDPGHGPNRGFGNSAFPDTWSDDNAIKAVEDVANSPKSIWQQATGQEVVEMHRKLLVVQIQTLLLPQEMVDQLDLLLKDKTIV